MGDKYKVTRSTHTDFPSMTKVETAKVSNTRTGESATASRWEYQDKDIVGTAIDRLRVQEETRKSGA